MEQKESIASLHRYYHCSVEMKYQFAEVWHGQLPEDPRLIWTRDQTIQGMYGYMYMSMWMAYINVVIEGWEKIGLSDPIIDTLLQSPLKDSLKIFRHTVFHYQKSFWAKMAQKHLAKHGFLAWVKELDKAFEDWFSQHKF